MAFYCLLNEHRRFIACVEPKCGSNTIRDWFIHTFPGPPDDSLVNTHRIPAETVADYDGYRKIFFIRDPLRRLVSFYTQFVVLDPAMWCFADDDGEIGLHDRSFEEFLRILEQLAEADVTFQHHLQPQTRDLGAVAFDDVIRLRDLDWRMVTLNAELGVTYMPRRLNARTYGVEPSPGAHRLSPQEHRDRGPVPPDSFYDDELRALAREIYADDVRFYESHPPTRSSPTPR